MNAEAVRCDAEVASSLTGILSRFHADGAESLRFQYSTIRIWEQKADDLFALGSGALPLALLTDDAKDRLRELVDGLDARLRELDVPDARRKLILTSSYILLGLRYNEGVLDLAFEGVNGMKESSTYQAILREGRDQERLLGQQALRDTLLTILRNRFGEPPVEMIVAALKESPFDTGLDLDALFSIAHYWEAVRESKHLKRGITTMLQMEVFSHQVPGGMMSNLISQLDVQKAGDRMPDVLSEIAKVRAEVGYPPLVTPLSQIVGTQAVLNVLTGKRWSVVPNEMKDYIRGYYGKAPGPMDLDIVAKVLGGEQPLSCAAQTRETFVE